MRFSHHVGRQKTRTCLLEASCKLMNYCHFWDNLHPSTGCLFNNVPQLVFLSIVSQDSFNQFWLTTYVQDSLVVCKTWIAMRIAQNDFGDNRLVV
jgi:hypothetical protein